MSLQVWLPLTKDLRNQGLNNAVVTNNGATFNSAGKLGGCYQFNGSNNYIYATKNIYNSSYSYSLWFYTTSFSTTQCLGCCRNGVGVGFAIFLIGGKLRIDCGGSSQWTTSYTYPTNTWVHLTITFENTTVKYYINGECQQSYTAGLTQANWGTIFSIGASQANGSSYGNYLNGKLNDVRVYDHCLSETEVKQLSQGLILHYPLNRQGVGQENLLLNSTIPTSGSGASGITKSIAEDGTQKVVAASSNGNWCTFGNHNTTLALTKGDTFTFSMMIKSDDSIKKPTVYFQSGLGYYSMQGTMSSNWSIIYYTGTWSIDNLTTNIHLGFSGAPGTYYIKYFKIEKGDKVTPWAPNHTDEVYTTMGLNSTTEYDCSGFCNNGIWHGTHTNTSDTPKYAVSTTATGSSTTYLEGPVLPEEAKTVALWIKNTSKSSNGAIFNDKTTGLQIGLLNSLLYMNSKTSTAGFTTTHWVNGEWNHVVAVNNNGTRSLYVNGQPETQSGASNYYIHNADNCWLWNRSYNNNYPFNGSLSDLRVYATALSAEDVKSLYQNCATIDPDGTIRGQIRS